MGKSNDASNGVLNLIFQGTTWAGLARNDAAPLTYLYIALHTADPGPAGDQTTNETTYEGYARVAVARSVVGWSTSASETVSAQNPITFPPGSDGLGTAPFFSIGTESSGAGEIIYSGPVSPVIFTGAGFTPQLINTTITES